jgi:hypothetical protein
MAKRKSLWYNDNLQFARLLSEIAGCVSISKKDMKALCESMDLTQADINEIMDRAENAFEVHKLKLKGRD